MPKKINAALVKSHRTYTVQEAAATVNASPQTIRRWVNELGMKIIEGTRPWLIEGSELKKFASGTRRPKMAKPGPGEMTCMKCRAPRMAYGGMADYVAHDSKTGRLVSLCETCGSKMHLFCARVRLPDLSKYFDIQEWVERSD